MPPPSTASSYSLPTLQALLDRIIPEDEFPGAAGAGVIDYVLGQLKGDCAAEAPALTLGFNQLDVETRARGFGDSFAVLDSAQRDALLSDLESGRARTKWPEHVAPPAFFLRMVELATEGYYADPANGGNRGAVSWRMVGYDPRRVDPPPA